MAEVMTEGISVKASSRKSTKATPRAGVHGSIVALVFRKHFFSSFICLKKITATNHIFIPFFIRT